MPPYEASKAMFTAQEANKTIPAIRPRGVSPLGIKAKIAAVFGMTHADQGTKLSAAPAGVSKTAEPHAANDRFKNLADLTRKIVQHATQDGHDYYKFMQSTQSRKTPDRQYMYLKCRNKNAPTDDKNPGTGACSCSPTTLID